MTELFGINKWQDAFLKYSVPEISHLNVQLREHVSTKKLELRDLVGNRYRDMLKTSDIILDMNETVAKEDEALSDLCTAGKYSSWATQASNVAKFTDPQSRNLSREPLPKQAVEHLLNSVISFTKRHIRAYRSESYSETKYNQDHVLIARGIWLARQLLAHTKPDMGKRKFQLLKSDLDHLDTKFQATIKYLLLQGEGSDSIEFSSYNNLFLAYAISHQCSPVEALENTLAARLKHISHQLDKSLDNKPDEALPHILRLISSTFSIAKSGYKNNALNRVIYQQTEFYSLLDSPEFASNTELNIERFSKWLPDSISKLRAFPKQCYKGIPNAGKPSAKTSALLASNLSSFGNDVAELMAEKLPALFESIQDLHTLVELYRKVLILVQDTSSLRNLALSGNDDDESTFYRLTFLPLWVSRFNALVETKTSQLLATEESLSAIHSKILNNTIGKSNSLSTTDYIFSSDFMSDYTSAKGSDYATILIDALSDFSTGSIGDIKEISYEFKAWLESVASVQSHVEEFKQMKNLLSARFNVSADDKDSADEFDDGEDDEENSDFWRRTEKQAITTNHNLFAQHTTKSLTSVHGEMLKRIENLFEKNGNNIRGVVLLLRAVLLLESYFQSLAPFSKEESQRFVMAAYSRLGDCVTESLDSIDAQLYLSDCSSRELWLEAGSCPSGPSLYIFDYMSKLLRNLVADVGHDELLWCNDEGLNSLREKIGKCLLEKLNEATVSIETQELTKKSARKVEQKAPAEDEVTPTEDKEEAKKDEEETTKDEEEEENTNGNEEEEVSKGEDDKEGAKGEDDEEVTQESDRKDDSESPTEVSDPTPQPKEEPEVEVDSDVLSTLYLQTTMDSMYVCKLVGVPFPKDPKYVDSVSQDVLDKMDRTVQELVKRTRILYLPLAL